MAKTCRTPRYKATDTNLNREVAIKVLPPTLANDHGRRARLQREAHVLAALNHPNIAQIYGIEQNALVMELVQGRTLQVPQSIDATIPYALQIADALDAAHEQGIVLRAPIDLTKLPSQTPRNLRALVKRCLDRDIKTRLRDIGEARVALAVVDEPASPQRPARWMAAAGIVPSPPSP